MAFPDMLRVIDSHTEGEPTRVVIDGWPALHGATMAERRSDLQRRWDHLRSAVVCEPRGHDAMVGALLTAPISPDAAAGVIFFNNVGTLNMCGHGLIGVIRTLASLGRIDTGESHIDTPAGVVSAWLGEDDSVTIRNVQSFRHAADVTVAVPGVGTVAGDVAYGGNWFFLTELAAPALELSRVPELTQVATAIAAALRAQGVTGADGAPIDHVELVGPAPDTTCDSVNFVLCPGGAYDRSPCGTGTSAKLAAQHARGDIGVGQIWRQRSVAGGRFDAWLDWHDGVLHPYIRGRAWITAHAELRFDTSDPFRAGFTAVPS